METLPRIPIKIAFFMRCLMGGGGERVAVNLANTFARLGYPVDMVLATWSGTFTNHLRDEIQRVDLQCGHLWQSLPRLIGYLRDRQPDVLISGLHYPNEIAILAKHLSRSQTRVIVVEHNTLSVESVRAPQRSAQLTPLSSRLLYPFADRIVAVSDGVARDLVKTAKLLPQKISTIYNPIIEESFDPKAIQPAGHPWFDDPSIPVVVGIGRLMEQKDFLTLLKAVQSVNDSRSVRLLILGEGNQRSCLKNYIQRHHLSESIQLLGFISEPLCYLKQASVFVLSSQWEGFGNVLVEAMAMGVPVISTDCPHGPREILNGGEFGHLVPVGDPQAIAQAIIKVLDGDRRLPPREWLSQFTCEHAMSCYLSLV